MTKIKELQEEELENLSENEEIMDLENLIAGGIESRFPIIMEIPKGEKIIQASARIRPLTSVELSNATKVALNKKLQLTTSYDLEIVKMGLLTKDDKKFPVSFLEKLPGGVINDISLKIQKISGVKFNKAENIKLAEKMMGFWILKMVN